VRKSAEDFIFSYLSSFTTRRSRRIIMLRTLAEKLKGRISAMKSPRRHTAKMIASSKVMCNVFFKAYHLIIFAVRRGKYS
jgi:hypothetical protein